MNCPECQKVMDQVSMYGTDEEINIDYTCNNCGCFAKLQWTPTKKAFSEPVPTYAYMIGIKDDDIPF